MGDQGDSFDKVIKSRKEQKLNLSNLENNNQDEKLGEINILKDNGDNMGDQKLRLKTLNKNLQNNFNVE